LFQITEVIDGRELPKPFTPTVHSGEAKQFRLRFPSDGEWCEYQRSLKFTKLANSTAADERENSAECASKLIAKISIGEQPEHNGPEAAEAIGRLMRADVIDCDYVGGSFRVSLKVVGGNEVVHVLRMPTMAGRDRYYKNAVTRKQIGRFIETRVFLEPAAEFYDSLVVSSEGYGCPVVPIIHKQKAIDEVIRKWSEMNEDPDPES
jgi:hypothetical protein